MSRQAKRTLLQRLRKNLKHVIPPMLRTKKAREFAPEELQELCEFTGLEPEAVKEYLSRKKGRRISNEFDWLNPKNAPEYLWFYRGSRTYLFAADEAWDRAVELTEPGMKCLDFGGGGGRNALAMAAKGAKVYYVDIGLINSAFTKFRARRQNLELQVLDPLVQIDGRWVLDTAEAAKLEGGFDLIVCDNVLEHVHDYHLVLAKLAAVATMLAWPTTADGSRVQLELRHDEHLAWPTGLGAGVVAAALMPDETMTTLALWRYASHLEQQRQTSQRQQQMFWRRAFYPLSCIVMMALALPFAYLHARAGGVSLKVFGGIMLGIAFVLLNNIAGHLGLLAELEPWLVSAAPGLLFLLLSLGAFAWLVRYR